jgi:nitroreductase
MNSKAIAIKEAKTEHPVLDIIKKRWSARSFSPQKISDTDMATLFEAASWAASAGNIQPWMYVYAHKGTKGFDSLFDCLDGGNQIWNKNASVLIASIKRKTADNKKENAWASHDTGMANAQLFLQAVSMEIYPHPMAGFDKEKLAKVLDLDEDHEPVCMISLGYLDEPEQLEEPFRTREITPRTRKPVSEFTKVL